VLDLIGESYQATVGGAHMTGERNIAFSVQSRPQKPQKTQSSPYLMTAFPLFSSIRMTSIEQLSTHMAQPMHDSGSILSMAMLSS
jgi:hypothetical protein